MELEQALFTSRRTRQLSGYQLVARSSGIDESIAQFLCRWCPSHDALVSSHPQASSLNVFPVNSDRIAISRTVLGGPEYSGRGGLQTVTMLLVARREQLAGYSNDPLALLETARISGYLNFVKSFDFSARARLPDRCIRLAGLRKELPRVPLIGKIVELVKRNQPVVLESIPRIPRIMQAVIHQLPIERRLDLSFTTGLKHSNQRPFQIHHFVRPGIDIRSLFSRQGIPMLRLEKPVPTRT